MKIKQLIAIGVLALTAAVTVPQAGASVNFVFTLPNTLTPTSGITLTQAGGDFTFDIRLNYPSPPPTDAASLSYWFEVPTSIAALMSITGQTIANTANGATPWTVLAQVSPYPLFFTVAADGGFLRDNSAASGGDLGGGTPSGTGVAPSASTYYVSTLSFHLDAGAAQGTYSLQTTLSPPSSVAPGVGAFAPLPTASFLITIIPEPATWSLIGLGGLALMGVNVLRKRRKS